MESSQSKKRVICYIDGLNVYHFTKDNPSARINFMSLAQSLLKDTETLVQVYYFAAYATWRKDDFKKHKAYVAQLKKSGVRVNISYFSKTILNCHHCKCDINSHEEKATDVKMALQIYEDALKNRYDRPFIFSGDRDLIPAIQKVKKECPEKEIVITLPIKLHDISDEIMKHAHYKIRLRPNRIKPHLFPKPKEPKKSD